MKTKIKVLTPFSSLYRVTKKSWTLVVASSEEHARIVARKLLDQAFEANDYEVRAVELRQPHQVPEPWRGGCPFCHPGREHLYGDATCEEVIQHARQKRLEREFSQRKSIPKLRVNQQIIP